MIHAIYMQQAAFCSKIKLKDITVPTTTIQDEHPATPEEIWAILREMTRKQEVYDEKERLRQW